LLRRNTHGIKLDLEHRAENAPHLRPSIAAITHYIGVMKARERKYAARARVV